MFQTFKQAWGKSIQNVISIATESIPKVEIKALSEIKNPQCEVKILEPPILAPVAPVAPVAQVLPIIPSVTNPVSIPLEKSRPLELKEPKLEPKLVKISRVISTQTLEPKQEKIESQEVKECKAEKEVISLDYHWNVLKLMFLMHIISLVIMALLFFKK